jgi:hypothetical protein
MARREVYPSTQLRGSLAPATKNSKPLLATLFVYGQTRSLSTHAAAWKSGSVTNKIKPFGRNLERLFHMGQQLYSKLIVIQNAFLKTNLRRNKLIQNKERSVKISMDFGARNYC